MPQRAITVSVLLGAMGLAITLYLRGLASTLQFGDAAIRGFLLVPSLPVPLYVTMAVVIMAGVGLTLLAGLIQRRRDAPELPPEREPEALKTPWQILVSMLVSGTLLLVAILWLMRHGADLQRWLAQWRQGIASAPDFLAENTRSLLHRVDSPTAGYTLFVVVLVVYGGLALLGCWVLLSSRRHALVAQSEEARHMRGVRRAFSAGLRELQRHSDPRQAIIACYARLESLLEDYGVPAAHHLTPQEYMGTALQGLDLPLEAFAGLVQLFEQARYSLHPLDDAARAQAMAHLETLKAHLEWETSHA